MTQHHASKSKTKLTSVLVATTCCIKPEWCNIISLFNMFDHGAMHHWLAPGKWVTILEPNLSRERHLQMINKSYHKFHHYQPSVVPCNVTYLKAGTLEPESSPEKSYD